MKLLSIFILSGFLFGSAFAGEGHSAVEYNPVEFYEFDLEVENDGGKVKFEWDEFEEDEKIKWWKLAFSSKSSNISYPESASRYLGDRQDLDEATQWFDAGKYYFRLCAITQENNRYCSDVVTYEFTREDYEKKEGEGEKKYGDAYKKSQEGEKKYGDGYKKNYEGVEKHKDNYEKKYEGVKKHYETKKKSVESYKRSYPLSKNTRDKIEAAVEAFIERLEKKNYSDKEMTEKLDLVLSRLESLAKKPKYTALVGYMVKVIEKKRQEYDDGFAELESIFDGIE